MAERRFRDLPRVKEDLRASVDLVAFLSRYIDLTKRGERWIGLCPFHDDKKSPGFAVSPNKVYGETSSRGVWGCWTCEAKGDLYGFVQRFHECTFGEAIEMVAEAVQFDLSPYYRDLTQEEQLLEDRYACTDAMANLFTETLLSEPKKLAFFAKKGLSVETLRTFGVGYCPSLDFLISHVDRDILGFVEPVLGNRMRLFGARLVYAQFTPQGRVWGWFARQPDNRAEGTPKYIGTSRESPLHHPSGRLYGMFQARKLLRETQSPLLIVEGFHDAMATHQAGLPAVALCGTRLSDDQVEALRSHSVRKTAFCLDGDEAGRAGMFDLAARAHELSDLNPHFIGIPSEPEEFILERGIDAFRQLVDEAVCAIDYVMSQQTQFDPTTPAGKREFVEHLVPFLTPYPRRSLDRALGISAVARATSLTEEAISDHLDEKAKSSLINIPGEMIVLAEMVDNPQAWAVFPQISEKDFSLQRFKRIFTLARELYERHAEINIELLILHATNLGEPSSVVESIFKLGNVQRKNVETYVDDIHDKAIRRESAEFAEVMRRRLMDMKVGAGESIAEMIEGITDIASGQQSKESFSSGEAVTLVVEELRRRAAADSGIAGLDLGPDWKWTTQMLNGLRRKRITCVAAVSGVGKSMVAVNWIHKLSVEEVAGGKPAPRAAGLIVSMEMEAVEMILRLAAIDSGLPQQVISRARCDNDVQTRRVAEALDRVRSAKISWMTSVQSVQSIALKARMLQMRGELDYILIDYIQLIDLSPYPHHMSVTEKYSAASKDIKRLADSLDVPIILIAQLNRKGMEQDIPTGEHMGESYQIYRDCHACFTLVQRDTGFLFNLDKNRDGGKGVVQILFDHSMQTSNLRMKEAEPLKNVRKV